MARDIDASLDKIQNFGFSEEEKKEIEKYKGAAKEIKDLQKKKSDLVEKFDELRVTDPEFSKVSKELESVNDKLNNYNDDVKFFHKAMSADMIFGEPAYTAGDFTKFATEIATDVVTDPTNLIPIGLPFKLAGKAIGTGAKATRLMAATSMGVKALKYVDESFAGRVIKNVGQKIEKIDDKLSSLFNLDRFFSKLKTVNGEKIDASALWKEFVQGTNRGAGPEIKNVVDDFVKTLNVQESEDLGKGLAAAEDDVRKVFGDYRADKLKSEIAQTLDEDSFLLDGAAKESKGKTVDKITSVFTNRQSKNVDDVAYRTSVKQKRAKTINKVVNEHMAAERKAAREKIDVLYTGSEQLSTEGVKKLRNERREILNGLRDKDKAYGTLVKTYTKDLEKEVFTLRDNLKKITSSEVSEAFDNPQAIQMLDDVDNSMMAIQKKVNAAKLRISKVNVEKLKKSSRAKLIYKAQRKIDRLETSLIELQRLTREVRLSGSKSQKDAFKTVYRQIKSDVGILDKVNRADVRSAFKNYKGELKDIEKINKTYASELRQKLESNVVAERKLRYDLKNSVNQRKKEYANIDRFLGKKKDKLIKIVDIADSNKRIADDLMQFRTIENKVFEDSIKSLPKQIQPLARKARTIMETMKARGLEEGVLQSADSFYYMPRKLKAEFEDMVKQAQATGFDPAYKPLSNMKSRNARASFQKKRTTVSQEDYKQAVYKRYLEANPNVPKSQLKTAEEVVNYDIADILMDHMSDFELKSTRAKFERALAEKVGVKSLQNLPPNMKDLKRTLDYLYDGTLIKTSNPALKWGIEKLGKMDSAMRFILTGANPSFYVRNFAGYPFLAARTAGLKQGFNPVNAIDAVAVLNGDKNLKIGQYTAEQINAAMMDKGVFGSFIKNVLGADEKKMLMALNRKGSKVTSREYIMAMAKKMQSVDDYGRAMATVANLKAGKNLDDSITQAHKAMMDYNMINSPVDKTLQGMLGFYSFTRRNLPASIKEMVERPRNLAFYNQIVEKLAGGRPLNEDEIGLLNTWEKPALMFAKENADGLRQLYYSQGTVPLSEAASFVNDMSTGTFDEQAAKVASRASPLVQSFVKLFIGKDPYFQNKEINKVVPPAITDSIPPKVLKGLGFVENKGKYGTYWTGADWMVRAIAATPLKPLLDTGKLISKDDLLDYSIGAKVIPLDAAEKQKRQNIKRKIVNKRLFDIGEHKKGLGKGEFFYQKGRPVQDKKKGSK